MKDDFQSTCARAVAVCIGADAKLRYCSYDKICYCTKI